MKKVLNRARETGKVQVKEGKSARPRYHMYFPISEITDATKYGNLKKAIQSVYPFFDGNALDAARFIFGAECDESICQSGFETIWRYGKAHEAFLEHAKKCDPPDEYNADFEGTSLKPEDYSDIGQAKVLVREYGVLTFQNYPIL